MPRPQFSLKSMLVAVSLAAIGLGLISTDPDTRFGMCLLSIGAWGCWGAAIGALFGRAARGAMIGAALILPLVVAALCVPTE
jgi:hypothetical protein